MKILVFGFLGVIFKFKPTDEGAEYFAFSARSAKSGVLSFDIDSRILFLVSKDVLLGKNLYFA